MTAKEYLSRARDVREEVRQLERLRRTAYEQATRSTAQPSQAPAHGGSGADHDVLTVYAQYAAELDRLTQKLLRTEQEIQRVIAQVEDGRYRRLLRARYLEGMTWERIAVEMGYNYSHLVHFLHPRALAAVEENIQ